jgi:hypothetical protein
MKPGIHDKIFSKLNLSKEQVLDEIALLSAHQKLSEYTMEVDFFEKKYGTSFNSFDNDFQKTAASFEMENDWLAWKFAVEGKNYWNNIIKEVQ